MIARDEARCIERCLASVAPWMDEMRVLDTGSTDATAAIAARCGAVVHPFAWIDDFAAARNAALSFTQADWRLVLDADEWLVGGGPSLALLRAQAPAFIGQVCVSSLIEPAGTEAPSWLPRVLPRGVAYRGRVHEQPDSGLPRRRLAIDIAHDGYLAAQMSAKAGRNRRLLERELAEQPDDAYLNYQLGKELEVRSCFAAAAPYYRRAYAGLPAVQQGAVSWRHDLVVRLLFTLKRIGGFVEAYAIVQAEGARWEHSPDYHFTLGDLWLECALQRPQWAGEMLPRIEASWLRALEIGEQPQLPDSVRGRGSFLAAHNLAVYYRSLGQAVQADAWEQRAITLRKECDAARSAELAGSGRAIPAFAALPGA